MSKRKSREGTGYPSLQEIRGNPVPDRKGKKKASRDLSLDLSVSCVGWAFGYNKKVVRYGKFVFTSKAKTGYKLAEFAALIRLLIQVYKPDRLIIEAPAKRRGNTTARHFEQLGVVRQIWFEETGKEILKSWLPTAKDIKKLVGVKFSGNHDMNKKIMVDEVNTQLGLSLNFNLEKPKDKTHNDDDIADAIAVLLGYWNRLAKKKK